MIKTGQQNNTAGPVEYTAVADERWLPRNNFYVSSPSTTDQCDVSLWSKKEKNTDKIAIQSFTAPRANGRASGPVPQSVFLAVIDYSVLTSSKESLPFNAASELLSHANQASVKPRYTDAKQTPEMAVYCSTKWRARWFRTAWCTNIWWFTFPRAREWVSERANERMSAAQRAGKASRSEPTNE